MKKEERKEVKLTHIMANGEIRDSVKGYIKSADQLPETARRILAQLINEQRQKK